ARPGFQPASLIFDDAASPAADRSAAHGKENPVADIDEEGTPILRRVFGFVGLYHFALFGRGIPVERRKNILGAQGFGRPRIVFYQLPKKPARRFRGVVGRGIHAIFEKFRRRWPVQFIVLRHGERNEGSRNKCNRQGERRPSEAKRKL